MTRAESLRRAAPGRAPWCRCSVHRRASSRPTSLGSQIAAALRRPAGRASRARWSGCTRSPTRSRRTRRPAARSPPTGSPASPASRRRRSTRSASRVAAAQLRRGFQLCGHQRARPAVAAVRRRRADGRRPTRCRRCCPATRWRSASRRTTARCSTASPPTATCVPDADVFGAVPDRGPRRAARHRRRRPGRGCRAGRDRKTGAQAVSAARLRARHAPPAAPGSPTARRRPVRAHAVADDVRCVADGRRRGGLEYAALMTAAAASRGCAGRRARPAASVRRVVVVRRGRPAGDDPTRAVDAGRPTSPSATSRRRRRAGRRRRLARTPTLPSERPRLVRRPRRSATSLTWRGDPRDLSAAARRLTTSRAWTPSPTRRHPVNEPNLTYAPGQPRAGGAASRSWSGRSAASSTCAPTSAAGRRIGGGAEIAGRAAARPPARARHPARTPRRRDAEAAIKAAQDAAPGWRAMSVRRPRRDHPQGRRPAGRPVAPAAQRRHHARPVQDRVPGRDRRGLRADRLLALQRPLRPADPRRAADREQPAASGTAPTTARSRASSTRSRRSTSPRSPATCRPRRR